jgi:hypothetical protein
LDLFLGVSGVASEELAMQVKWNRTVNSVGGKGNNISEDFYNEHLNKKYKENSKVSAGQLTDESIKT